MTATIEQPQQVGEQLVALLREQRRLYRQLQELAAQQSSLVDGRDPETLLRVLASRQRLIVKLTQTNQQLEPLRQSWDQIAGSLSAEHRQEVQQLIAQVQDMLAAILSQDERDAQSLMSQRSQVAGEIRNTQKGKKMNQAYGRPAGTQASRYFDSTAG